MPVDKFGRTDAANSTRVISGGVTLSQVNNLFLRRDGENTATSDLNLDSHKLINVTDPTNDQDVVTKKYMNDRVILPTRRFLSPYATGLNTYDWKEFQVIPPETTTDEFDNIPAGLYGCYTGYIPLNRLGTIPTNTKGYMIVVTYQQPVDRNKYYTWINATNGDDWQAYFRNGTWTPWTKSNKVLKTGDTMTGDLSLTTSVPGSTRNLGCQTITSGQNFNLWLGTPDVRLSYTDFLKYLALTIDGGFQIQNNNGILFTIGVNPYLQDAATFYVPIIMGGRSIVEVADPVNAQDAATKSYTDTATALKVSKSGDAMTGDLALNVGTDQLRTLGCSDLSGSKRFNVLLGSVQNQIQCQLNQPIAVQATDGVVCRQGSTNIIRFGMAAGDLRTAAYKDIIMNQNYIADLHDPTSAQDAATKNYADNLTKKCYLGYIPLMDANVSRTGFVARASGDINGYAPYGAFNYLNGDGFNGSWITTTLPCWLQIQCPEPVVIWRVALKARNIAGRNITGWNISGSNDRTTFTTLLTSTTALLGASTAPTFFNISTTTAYQYYRINITSVVGNPDWGLQAMQLYTLST